MLTVFQMLADDMAGFAETMAKDFLQLLDTLLGQITGWLGEPVDIPFVSALYQALTEDQLSILDLICLLAAVPATILLDVITGSPTVPDTITAGQDGPGARDRLASAAPQAGSCSASQASSSASSARPWTFSCRASTRHGATRARPTRRWTSSTGWTSPSTSPAGQWA